MRGISGEDYFHPTERLSLNHLFPVLYRDPILRFIISMQAPSGKAGKSWWSRVSLLGLLLTFGFAPLELRAQADYKRYYDEDNLPKVREIFYRGRYDIVIQICDYALRRGQPSWEWRTLRFESLANVGRYEEAVEEALETTDLFPGELGALLRAHEMFESMGLWEEAESIYEAINAAAGAVPVKDRTAMDYVSLGRAALVLGADPATVLEEFYGVAKTFTAKGQNIPAGLLEAHLASGELALMKDDFGRAGKEFQEAYKLDPTHPEVLFGLAQAFMPSDRTAAGGYLEKVIEEAPLHVGALLMLAESAINYEQFDVAKEKLDQVESLNPRHPLAAAYRAVLVELEWNDHVAFELEREKALSVWAGNPEIDHLIGRVLSRKYRYLEGAKSQERALALDPGFLPAKLQLALDYLRLGRVEEAWPLAEEVADADEYNVLAYNLAILRQEIESFASIQSDDFIIRMPPEEAEIYGDRVLELLTEAKEVLSAKYGMEITERILIEFYPRQQDFAIRTFGSLGGEGLLGVCFGSVVTMNSPGSTTAGKSNWEATLWHEYCHVITLTATKNRMPRWLSEGISVYEELQRQPNWGQRMTPRYRRMILEEDALTPISEMSQAFFNAGDGEQLMFAYYQSMLVVEYIVEKFGLDALRSILSDLGEGVLINAAIEKHTEPMEQLERDFAFSAFSLAQSYGPGVDWSTPEEEEVNPRLSLSLASYLKKNPTNFWALQTLTGRLLDEENWGAAADSAESLIQLLPDFTGMGNGYTMKARALREMGDAEGEMETLERLAGQSAEALTAYHRLLEVEFESGGWSEVIANAERAKAINPFNGRVHYCRGCAHAALAETGAAVSSFEKALLLDPANPSEIRFRLAGLVKEGDGPAAKRYLLDALADSPRYQEAHSLLLDLLEPATGEEDL